MKFFLFPVLLFLSYRLVAQPVVKVDVTADTIAVGQTVEITYNIQNSEGKFSMPDISNLPVVSGPNTSTSFLYQNGKQSSSQSYAFTLMAIEEGKLIVPEAAFIVGEERIIVQPVEVVVRKGWDKAPSDTSGTKSTDSKATREKKKF